MHQPVLDQVVLSLVQYALALLYTSQSSHMSMVLGVLLNLQEMEDIPSGTIRFIFQPAEEKGSGALKMIEKKVVDDVDYLYGVHLRPFRRYRMAWPHQHFTMVHPPYYR